MKKLPRFIYILCVCALVLSGCNARTYPGNITETEDTSIITPTTTPPRPTETTTAEPTTTTSKEPTPYELLLAGEALNSDNNVFQIPSDIAFDEHSYIAACFEWQNGFFLAVSDALFNSELSLYYMDFITHEIFAAATLPCENYGFSITSAPNDTIIISALSLYGTTGYIYIYDNALSLRSTYTMTESTYFDSHPVISEDGRYAYYCGENGLICYRLNLATGISEAIIYASAASTSMTASDIITIDDRDILVLTIYNEIDFETTYEYYDLHSLELIQTYNFQVNFDSCGEGYGGRLFDTVTRLIYLPDTTTDFVKEFYPEVSDEYYSCWFQPNNMLLTVTDIDTPGDKLYNHSRIRAYDLNTGLCQYETVVPLNPDTESSGYVYQLIYSEKYNAVFGIYTDYKFDYSFFVWDLNSAASRSGDTAVYTDKFYAPDEINHDGIAALKASANELSAKYGVNICIADDVRTDTGDYTVAQVLQTSLIRNALKVVEEALANYPKNFFRQLQSDTGVPLEINLAGTISPIDGYDSINTAIGLHNYNSGEQYVVLDINNTNLLETTIYHEIFHAIDWIIVFNSTLFDADWLALNPEDFEYDYGYISNKSNNDTTYLYYTEEGYFIDIYSKSFPNEDRARIIENAMSGNAYCFESEGLRNKLDYICRAIREVFDSSSWEEPTCWEAALLPVTEEGFNEALPKAS